MKTSSRERREQRERIALLRSGLEELRAQLAGAYRTFDRCTDPMLIDAVVLEIGALRSRYDAMFRTLKTVMEDSCHADRCTRHRAGARRSAPEASQAPD